MSFFWFRHMNQCGTDRSAAVTRSLSPWPGRSRVFSKKRWKIKKKSKTKLNNYFAKKRGVDRSTPRFSYYQILIGKSCTRIFTLARTLWGIESPWNACLRTGFKVFFLTFSTCLCTGPDLILLHSFLKKMYNSKVR